jgi:hypothetical protein
MTLIDLFIFKVDHQGIQSIGYDVGVDRKIFFIYTNSVKYHSDERKPNINKYYYM